MVRYLVIKELQEIYQEISSKKLEIFQPLLFFQYSAAYDFEKVENYTGRLGTF